MKKNFWIEVLTWTIRLLEGCTFLFSGFVKAIDPWGLLYKTDDYLAALSIDIWDNLQLVGVFGLSAIEFIIGVFLILGCFRKSVAIAAVVMMAFMLPLTLWLAIADPIKDCGCFGDAVKISNWGSFCKNIFLMAGAIWLVKNNGKCSWLVTPALQWLVLVASGIFIIIIETVGYASQPLLDFRPYKKGEKLLSAESTKDDEVRFVFIYENNGVSKEFLVEDELPDESEGWQFVGRKEIGSTNVSDADYGKNLRLWSRDGEDDVTEEAISDRGKELLVMMPDLKAVSPATTWKLNSLYEWAQLHNVEMIGVVSGSQSDIEEWEDISMASYPIFTADDTHIKEVVRGNPGVVYLVDGIVEWKSTLTAINIDDFLSPDISDDARSFGLDNIRLLRNCCYIYLITLIMFILLSFIPKVKEFYLQSFTEKQAKEKDSSEEDHS